MPAFKCCSMDYFTPCVQHYAYLKISLNDVDGCCELGVLLDVELGGIPRSKFQHVSNALGTATSDFQTGQIFPRSISHQRQICQDRDSAVASTSGQSVMASHFSLSAPLSFYNQQFRGYKSNKRSLKPLNNAASWKAAEPFLPPHRGSSEESDIRRETGQSALVDSCIPPVPEVPKPEPFRRVGVIKGQYNLELQNVFAVVEAGGTQFKVTTDDVFFVNYLRGAEVNDVLELPGVMLLGNRGQTIIGRPYIPGASVLVAVEEHFKDGKVHVFKRKPRKRYRRYKGERQLLTTLRVLKIKGILPVPKGTEGTNPLPITWVRQDTKSSHKLPDAQQQPMGQRVEARTDTSALNV
ncbi:hypothetical protein CEUSTIGMA_g8061.t1 [Chlamydomonas eustigma]|uniref:Large ribosomal subunit protein bL21m n=1 Tax=Chlamydomonas eustigma TaxID=1157962 RepID=A0A250XC50_9CHLO|nr:hypothetical protein CEUSTIGMA_g8061.t1 [Chlamydomonas eustigma]|eukprot:GAX80626.1 hypothetical protein CEUSTIGMA_g8061.t1 [Chlamydomonas eustigma]